MITIHIFLLFEITISSKVILMIRHSQRAPIHLSEVDAARWGPYLPSDLTQIGIDFLISKGASLRLTEFFQIYDSLGNCMVDKMEIISSPKQRTILSTYSFIKGLCPHNFNQVSDFFTSSFLSKYATIQEDLEYIIKFDFQNIIQLSNYTRSFKIIPDYLFHGSDTHVCPIMGKITDEIKNSKVYHDKDQYFRSQSSFKRILQHMRDQRPIDAQTNPQNYKVQTARLKDLKAFFGDYKCNLAQLLDVPQLQDDEKNLLEEISVYLWYDLKYSNLKQNQASLTPIFEWIIGSIQDQNSTLHIYSGHDANLINVLAVILDKQLKKVLMIWGADIQFIFQKGKVIVELNGEKMKTNFCVNGYVCKVEKAINFLKKYIVNDVSLLCGQ